MNSGERRISPEPCCGLLVEANNFGAILRIMAVADKLPAFGGLVILVMPLIHYVHWVDPPLSLPSCRCPFRCSVSIIPSLPLTRLADPLVVAASSSPKKHSMSVSGFVIAIRDHPQAFELVAIRGYPNIFGETFRVEALNPILVGINYSGRSIRDRVFSTAWALHGPKHSAALCEAP